MLPLIYGSAITRLHAELALVRLGQAGIGLAHVSVFYPQHSRPRHALWTKDCAEFPLSTGEPVLVSGFLRSWLKDTVDAAESNSLAEGLRNLGLLHGPSQYIEGCLREGRAVVAAAEWDEFRASVVVECLRGVGTENIRQAMIDDRRAAILGFRFQSAEAELPMSPFGRVPA